MSYYKVLSVLAVVALVASCGFRPLHGGRAGAELSGELASIEIKPIADRAGQRLRNHLQDFLSPYGRPKNPAYTLYVTLNEGVQHLAVKKSAFSTRVNLNMTARFTLSDAAGGKALFTGTAKIVSSYNILNSDYATLMAEKDARKRGVRELSNDIGTRLSAFLSKARPPLEKPGP